MRRIIAAFTLTLALACAPAVTAQDDPQPEPTPTVTTGVGEPNNYIDYTPPEGSCDCGGASSTGSNTSSDNMFWP